MARVIFLLIDGLADKASSKTPLKLAQKPNIQKLLKKSFLAEFYPLTKKDWPKFGSASITGLANLNILGYQISPQEVKRGPLEAIGSDIDYQNGELALRVDFATVDENLRVIDRRAGRNIFGFYEFEKAINALNFEIPFHFHRTYGHRAVLIFKTKLSPWISDSDPLKTDAKVKKIKPLKNDSLSKKTAKIVQKFLDETHYLLDNHPFNNLRKERGILKANYLLTREAGNSLPKLKKCFKNSLVIAENGVVKGGCLLAGFEALTLPEIENLNQRYQFLKKAIIDNFPKYNLIYLHLKEADEASHDKNFQKKKEFFEFFDKWLNSLIKNLPKETIFVITGDHITSAQTGKHLYGPLPILIINHPTPNQPKEFSELEAKKKKIKIEPKELWEYLGIRC